MDTSSFDRISARSPKDSKIFVSKSLDIAERLNSLLIENGMSQKDLAKKLNKRPSEINKWLSGLHNFTLKSIAKIEAILNEQILVVAPGKSNAKENLSLSITIPYAQEVNNFESVNWKNSELLDGGEYLKNLEIGTSKEKLELKTLDFKKADYAEFIELESHQI